MSKSVIANSVAKKAHYLYIFLGGFFIVNAVIAEMIGVKIFSLERTLGMASADMRILGVDGLGYSLTAGVILWPVVFVMTDIINEYFGQKGVRRLSYLTVGLLIYAFAMIYGAIALAPDTWWAAESGLRADGPDIEDMQLAFERIFGQGLWIIIGSLVAFLVGQILDVAVFHRIKRLTGDNKLWLRATGSTLVSQLVDSFVVLVIAFYIGAGWDLSRVLAICLVNYSYKLVVAIVLTPLLYVIHAWIDRYLGVDLSQQLRSAALEDS